jgi:Skp family chaperone for outer membrane proteins
MKTKSFTYFATLAVTAAGFFALSGTVPAVAQSGPPPAPIIGVVNTDALLRESSAAKSVLAAREKYLTVYQNQAKELSDKLRAEDQELGNQRNILAQDVWQEKASAFQKKFAEAQGQVREKEGRLEYATNQAMQEVLNTLRVVAQGVASERGVNLVIPQGTLLSFDPAMDLTAAVMTKLNARLPSVKFQDPDTIQLPDEDKQQAAGSPPAKTTAPAKKK